MTPAKSEEKGRLPTHPMAGVLAIICKKWVSRKTMRSFEAGEVDDDEMDRRASEVWGRKASDPQLGVHLSRGRSRSSLAVP